MGRLKKVLKSRLEMIVKALRIRKKNKIAVEAAGYVKAQTNWKGKDISFHPNSSRRFEVIEVAREANFNPIEEYRWADVTVEDIAFLVMEVVAVDMMEVL
ncbi:unnamed protein product [Prunus armeniaca]